MKINCYYFWNDHQALLKNLFELTMSYFMPKIILHPIKFSYTTENTNFFTQGFKQLMLEKAKFVKQIIDSNLGKEILISDIDIIVCNNFEQELVLNDKDIIFQKEFREPGVVNTGFIFLKCSTKCSHLWEKVINNIFKKDNFTNEQEEINKLLFENFANLNYSYFSDNIWAHSNQPRLNSISLYHANQALNLQEKKIQIKNILMELEHPLKEIILTRLQ